jgi:hypothetical protein
MNDTTYNGWTNYATWRIFVECIDGINPHDMEWPMTAYELSNALRDHQKEYILDTTHEGITRYHMAAYELSNEVLDHIEDYIVDTTEGIARYYELAFLIDVNWREIAEYLINQYADAA